MWRNISLDELRIGQYIRLDYPWFAHPFPRSTFRIGAQRDIELIRQHQLVRLEWDPDRSEPEAPRTVAGEAVAAVQEAPLEALRLERKQELQQWSTQQVQRINAASEELAEDSRRLMASLQGLANGNVGAFDAIAEQVEKMAARTASSGSAPMFAGLAFSQTRATPEAIETCSAIVMSQLITQRMHFDDQLRHQVGLATAMRQIGSLRFSASDRRETGGQPRDAYKQYPVIGAAMLRSYVGMPQEVVRMVLQHRERRDGTGFPNRLVGSGIFPGALVIGAIHEFQLMTSEFHLPAPLSPASALRRLYRDHRQALGADVVDNLIAAMTVYPPGTFVTLSDGSQAMVLKANAAHRLSPVVLVLSAHDDIDTSEVLDLSTEPDLTVAGVLAVAELPPAAARLQSRNAKGGLTVEGPMLQVA